MLFEQIDHVFNEGGGRLLGFHVVTLGMAKPKEMGECDRDRRLA